MPTEDNYLPDLPEMNNDGALPRPHGAGTFKKFECIHKSCREIFINVNLSKYFCLPRNISFG